MSMSGLMSIRMSPWISMSVSMAMSVYLYVVKATTGSLRYINSLGLIHKSIAIIPYICSSDMFILL